MKIINETWRGGNIRVKPVGVILTKRDEGTYCAYIGGIETGSDDKEKDIDNIIKWGSKLLMKEAQAFFPHNDINSDNYKR